MQEFELCFVLYILLYDLEIIIYDILTAQHITLQTTHLCLHTFAIVPLLPVDPTNHHITCLDVHISLQIIDDT
jgi:hypothetical protein